MAEPSYGSVLTCILATSFIMLYLILLNQKKRFIVRYGAGAFLALTLLLILRAVLPCNFSFSHNILSKKILPPFFDVITFKAFGIVSLMDFFVSIWILGFLIQSLRLCIKQYQFCKYIKTLGTTKAYNNIEKGDYWIKKITRNMERDEDVNKQLMFRGWTVLRFWGDEIKKNTDECVKVIEEAIFDISMEE